ncbi:MAG: L7Ae/L30e/S12e/Gadd45 family ribosomal protein [Gemmatimonadales bacterium]
MSDLLGLLGLGVRSRSVVVGTDRVREALQRSEVRCVVMAADASPRATEKVLRLAQARSVPVITGPDAATLGARLGKPPVMAVGVCNAALAAGIVRQGAGQSVTEA